MEHIDDFTKYPWWWSLYSFIYASELWKPTYGVKMKKYTQQFKFNTFSKDIIHECFTENKIKYPKIDFNKFLGNDVFDNMTKWIKLHTQKTNKITELIKKKKFKAAHKVKERYDKLIQHNGEYIRTYSVELNITLEQTNIINQWFDITTKLYNKCVDAYNNTNGKLDLNFKKIKKNLINSLSEKDKKACPYNILSYEVKVFCENVKSCLTQLKNGNINQFKMGYKKTDKNKTISIEKANIQRTGFYKTYLGAISAVDKGFSFDNVACDCKLIYDIKQKKYYLYAPQYILGKNILYRNHIASLDPGELNFMTYYGLDHIGTIGKNIRVKILKYEEQIRYIQRKMAVGKDRKCQLKRALHRKYNKIKGLVKELHNKAALYLCKNYNIILIPSFGTQNMISDKPKSINKVKKNKQAIIENGNGDTTKINAELKSYKKQTRLNSRVKFVMNSLSHYKFKQQLLAKGEEYGCAIIEVDESYTSMACGNCGHLSKKYVNRIKECSKCNFQIDRDYNGSRNILIHNLSGVRVKPVGVNYLSLVE